MRFILFLFVLWPFVNISQTTYYVDQSKTGNFNDGLSWQTAINDLSNALNLCSSGDQIWVKSGTYFPNNNTYLRSRSFILKNNVKIYGSFQGNEISINQRDLLNNPTILSGDVGILGDKTDNTLHVVIAESNNTIDGFIIKDSNANGLSDDYIEEFKGGGIYFSGGDNHLINSTLKQNFARNGAAAFFKLGNSTIENCIIEDNVSDGYGAGIEAKNGRYLFKNNKFLRNSVYIGGGGIYLNLVDAEVIGNFFSDNYSQFYGGGIDAYSSVLKVSNNVFNNNRTSYAYYGRGGAINTENGRIKVQNNTLIQNKSNIGGAIYLQNIISSIQNNIFSNNYSVDYNLDIFGVNIFSTLLNNLLQNTESNYLSNPASNGNFFTGNPNFVNPQNILGPDNIFGTNDDGLNLNNQSICINSGNSTDIVGIIDKDVKGNKRIQDTKIDLGAYEINKNCNQNIVNINSISGSGVYEALNIINATSIQKNWTHYFAGNSIQLSPGFETIGPGIFEARILNCLE